MLIIVNIILIVFQYCIMLEILENCTFFPPMALMIHCNCSFIWLFIFSSVKFTHWNISFSRQNLLFPEHSQHLTPAPCLTQGTWNLTIRLLRLARDQRDCNGFFWLSAWLYLKPGLTCEGFLLNPKWEESLLVCISEGGKPASSLGHAFCWKAYVRM